MSTGRPKIQTEDIAADILKVTSELGWTPLSTEYDERGEYSLSTVQRRFGSWDNGLMEAGLEPYEGRVPNGKIVADIQRVATEIGHVPTSTEYEKHGSYSKELTRQRFGTWDNALTEAGFEPLRNGRRSSEETLLADLVRVAEELQKPPTETEYEELGEFSAATLRKRFDEGFGSLAFEAYSISCEFDEFHLENMVNEQ